MVYILNLVNSYNIHNKWNKIPKRLIGNARVLVRGNKKHKINFKKHLISKNSFI